MQTCISLNQTRTDVCELRPKIAEALNGFFILFSIELELGRAVFLMTWFIWPISLNNHFPIAYKLLDFGSLAETKQQKLSRNRHLGSCRIIDGM